MAELLQPEGAMPDFREVGAVLAKLSGVDLSKARPAKVREWEARGLAMLAMARDDVAIARRVMANINSGRERGKKTGAECAPREQR